MSYMRAGWDLKYVEGVSKDYVFASIKKGKEYIQDYGGISDEGFIELLIQEWKTEDLIFKNHLIKRLADRLKVKLRKKPLEWDIISKRMNKRSKDLMKSLGSGEDVSVSSNIAKSGEKLPSEKPEEKSD